MNNPDETVVLPTARALGIAISREELGTLPIRHFAGPIEFISHDDQMAAACAALQQESLLGFDIETKPSFRVGESYPPALLQLAGASTVYVFQLLKLTHLAPLLDVLANVMVTKAGVALADDLKKLREAYAFEPAGFIDIGILAREQAHKQTGLRALAGLLLGFRISKKEQRSNWGSHGLTRSQIAYAATDAWVSRELYLKLAGPPP